ncbi:hypothetical protein GY45DRAFT_1432230 [Cubamyces sp. BRFM 1775]|nr:hypothetical protein GY45DRAFT_1432230 [Cubamyces sp. BRFM 1775]
MIIYPLVLVASLLFGAFSDLAVVFLGPIVTPYHIPLLGVAPSHFRSFASPSLLSGPSASVNTWSRYGSCVDLDRSLWGLSGLLTIPALAGPTPSESGLTVFVPSFTASEEPLLLSSHASSTTWSAAYLVNILVACHYVVVACGCLVVFYWISRGFALFAYTFFYRLTYVVDVQRMDSPWSFYSVGLLAETSLCGCHLFGAPELLVHIPSDVPRATPSLRPVPPALAEPPCPLPEQKKVEKTHRGRRGGKRQHRRRHALDQAPVLDSPQAPALPPATPPQDVPTRAPADRPLVWDAPLGDVDPNVSFTSNGSGRVVSTSDARSTYFVDPPRADEPAPPAQRPTRSTRPTPTTPPPAPAAALPQTPPDTILGRTYSPCEPTALRPTPAITTFRRKHSPPQTLGIVTVRVVPSGKLNQRARRALAAQSTLGKFLKTH